MTELGLRLVGVGVLGRNSSDARTDVFNWNTRNHADGSYTLECYAIYQGGLMLAGGVQVSVVN